MVREKMRALSDKPIHPDPIETPIRRPHLAFLIAPIVAMIVAGYAADALWPNLVQDHPLWLIGLSAKNRYLVLIVNQVDLSSYYLIGVARLLLPDPFFFAIGWFYGPAALRWMERRTPTMSRYMTTLERWFGKWGAPLVVLFPNNYVCLIAGVARMSPWLFAALNIVGTVGRLFMLQLLGDVFAGPISSILGFVSTWRLPLLAVSIGLVAITSLGELRRGKREIRELEILEHSGESPASDLDDISDSDSGRIDPSL